MTPTSRPREICETVKINVKGTPRGSEEESKGEEDTIQNVVESIAQHLEKERNDGNKVYEILSISSFFGGEEIKRTAIAATELEKGSDVYVKVRITIDTSKHV